MEKEGSVSSRGSINLDARPKKSILKRSEPDAAESAGGGGGREGVGGAARRHVPFSHIIPELSHLEEEDSRLGGAGAGRVPSDLQSVSSAASLSPLSSDEQVDGAESAARGSSPRHGGRHRPVGRSSDRAQQRRRRTNNRRTNNGRRGGRGHSHDHGHDHSHGHGHVPPGAPMVPMMMPLLAPLERLSPARGELSPLPPLGSLSPRPRSPERRSLSPLRRVRYSPSPERRPRGRHSRSPPHRSRSRSHRSRSPPPRRSRSPLRRSRSPGAYGRGLSPRYRHSPAGHRGWSRSPSPRRRRSRSRSRSPPWGRSVERSLLAMSRSGGVPPAGYGPPVGMPGYPPLQYVTPGPPPPPAYMQPMPYANPPGPPLHMSMPPGVNPAYGQPMYAAPVAPMYPMPQPQLQLRPQLQPQPAASMSGAAGVSERIDSETFLREVERRRQQKTAHKPERQLTDVLKREQSAEKPADTAKPAPTEAQAKELREIQKEKPWMTQELMELRREMDENKKTHGHKNKYFRILAKKWNSLVMESKQKLGLAETASLAKQVSEGGPVVSLSAATVTRLTEQQKEYITRRDSLAGQLHQLKLEQKTLDNSNIIWKRGQPTCNKKLVDNLKQQGELLKELESVVSVVGQLKQVLDPVNAAEPEANLNGVGNALLKAAKAETEGGNSKPEVRYLLLGDETLGAVQVYIREQEARAAFGTVLPAEQIRLVSRPDAALSSVEFRHWVRAAVRQSAAETLVLLASARCLEVEAGQWTAAAAVAPLLPLLRDLRADGLTRAVVVGVPARPGAAANDAAALFNRALQEQLETAGPHVPRVTYTPIKGGPQDGFGQQTEGGLTLDLYRTLLQTLSRCEQLQSIPGVPAADESEPPQLQSMEEAADTLQGLLDGLRGRLAGDEAAGLGAVAAMLDKLRSQSDGVEQLLQQQEHQNLDAEDPAVFFRDPADHICLHCQQIFLNAKAYLEHLKSADHMKQYQASQQGAPELPWQKDIPPIEKKVKNAESKPIKGLDMFVRVDCWYCKVCEMFVGDLRCASSHLKSRRHNAKYDEYLENNPSYHAVVGETRSRLLMDCAVREQERTRRRRREEAERRGDQLNERMRRQSEGGVQDVTDEAGAAGAGAAAAPGTPVTPPTAAKKAGIKLNLLAAPTQPSDELGELKRKVQANIAAAEQLAKRSKEEEAADQAIMDALGKEQPILVEAKKEMEEAVATVANQAGGGAAKVKITLPEKVTQKPAAASAAAKKKVMPIVGKLPKLRPKKPEPAKPEKPAPQPQPPSQPSKSEQTMLELANRKEVLASIPTPAVAPPAAPAAPAAVPEPQTEAISDDEGAGDMLDLLDIDLPDADADRRADADELRMLGICDEDVAAQRLPATRPPP